MCKIFDINLRNSEHFICSFPLFKLTFFCISFQTEELFSYLGGITGGWLGISLLEFCAFVEGVMSVIFFSFRYCKPKSRSKKKKVKKSPKKVSPIFSRHCNCHCNEDFGSLLLAFPVSRENSARAVQVVPFEYY